jgi:hypothetical protein
VSVSNDEKKKDERYLRITMSKQIRLDLKHLRDQTHLKNHMLLSYLLRYVRLNPMPFLEWIHGQKYIAAGREMVVDVKDAIRELVDSGLGEPAIIVGLMENIQASGAYGPGPDSKEEANRRWAKDPKMSGNFRVFCGRCGALGSRETLKAAKSMRTLHLENNKDTDHYDNRVVTIEDKEGNPIRLFSKQIRGKKIAG